MSYDITDRKQAENTLRASEERQAFLLELSDALRPLADPVEVQRVAARVLGRHLGASRAAYAEIDSDDAHFTVHHDYTDGVPSFAGRHLNGSYGPGYFAELHAGRTVMVSDAQHDARLSGDERAAYAAVRTQAAIAVPLIKGGRLVAVFTLHFPTPHVWTPAEATLVEAVAERTWAAVERAHAEKTLRDSEKRFRAVANLVPDLLWESRPDGFTTWYNERWLDYTGQTFEQATGWGWTDAIHPDDREGSARRSQQAVDMGQPLRQEHRIRRHDGVYRWFVVSTSPLLGDEGEDTRMYGAATDIHHLREQSAVLEARVEDRTRQLAETNAELASQTQALEAFAELSRNLALHLDPYALIRRVQDVALSLLPGGFATYYEPEGTQWRLRVQAGDMRSPALQAAVDAGLELGQVPSLDQPWQTGRPLFQDYYAPDTDGLGPLEHGTNAVATLPLTVADRPVGVFAVALFGRRVWSAADRAVLETIVRHLDLALDRAAQLQQVERQRERLADLNAELGTLITRTARDLRVPAAYFSRFLEPERAEEVLADLTPAVSDALENGLAQLQGVAHDLQALAQLESQAVNQELVPLGELFEALKVTAAEQRPATWFVQPLPIVRADRALLKQALEVLLSFVLSETRGARYVTVTSQAVQGEVWVTVVDDGTGLSGEEAATLFDLTVRTEQQVPLLAGSGLMQVRRILARHGGWAWAEPELTGGKVVLAFPRDEAVTELEAFLDDPPGSGGT
ncbi:GAF domain-containing protein [Deinococcus radiotolerans]|uniref:histidine kinase n=1 Tax=Deinococcus radiotolerans TaxID=1309407 RepID=A0ABQ2FL37_9DEIO|nr:GAF domain-containing protein [Deinococcus radiotolerans]GGL08668.1 hypothetical protein GCM10010844_29290 [Deinococcus radiotolerans]